MKTKIIIACLFVWGTTQAQDFTDALRYSEDVPEGNARFAGMAGSMSALGGNLSAVSYNPAGLAVYQTGIFEFGLGGLYNSTNAKYLGETNTGVKAGITFSNLGVAGCTTDLENDLGIKNINYAFTINRLNDFNGKTVIGGSNNNGSMVDDFGNLLASGSFSDYYEALAYKTYIMDWDTASKSYFSHVNPYDWKRQTNTVTSSGNKMEYGFSFGANFSDVVYLGGSLNIQSFKFTRSNSYTEKDLANAHPFESFTLTTNYTENGSGVNLKLGAIVHPIKNVRFGLAIHTPTVLSIESTYGANMSAYYDELINGYSNYAASAPNDGTYSYSLITPFKTIASLGISANKTVAFNFDYEYVDYSSARFEMPSSDANFEMQQNNEISNRLKAAQNLRAGAEVWFGKFGFRAGTALYSNPYSSSGGFNYLDYKMKYTGGFSIRSKNTYFDLAYVRTVNKGDQILYTDYYGNYVTASTTQNANRLIATIGFKF